MSSGIYSGVLGSHGVSSTSRKATEWDQPQRLQSACVIKPPKLGWASHLAILYKYCHTLLLEPNIFHDCNGERTPGSSTFGTSCLLPHESLSLANLNLNSFSVIIIPMSVTAFSELRFWTWGCFGTPNLQMVS